MGARFEYEGVVYVKTGPLTASSEEGGQRIIPRYAILKALDVPAVEASKSPVKGRLEDWSSRDVPGREAPILDALDRGLAAAPTAERRIALDVGGADGINSRHLTPVFPEMITLDLSLEMLQRSAGQAPDRVQADGSCLPVPDRSVDAIFLINAFLFPGEVERVLAPNGVLIWVNSRGAATPIGLPAPDVDRALPGAWSGVASSAGWGTWSVHWRS